MRSLASGLHADVVRQSQDVVELILKGALWFVAVDPPKRHDVHHVVVRYIDRFPAEWRRTLAELQEALDTLAEDRAPAFYGDEEEEEIPGSDLVREEAARAAGSRAAGRGLPRGRAGVTVPCVDYRPTSRRAWLAALINPWKSIG
jgi:HEPN domain-containing protein